MNGTEYIPVGSSQKTHTLWYIFDLIEDFLSGCIYTYIYIYLPKHAPQEKKTIYITEGV